MDLLPVQSPSVTINLGAQPPSMASTGAQQTAMYYRPPHCSPRGMHRFGFMRHCHGQWRQGYLGGLNQRLGGLQTERQGLELRKTQLSEDLTRLYAAQAHWKKVGASKHKTEWNANKAAIQKDQDELKKIDERLAAIGTQEQGLQAYRAGFQDAMAGPSQGSGLWHALGQWSGAMGWGLEGGFLSGMSGMFSRLFG
jgi:hypothetical protein